MLFYDAITLIVVILAEVVIYLLARKGPRRPSEIRRVTLWVLGVMSATLGFSLWLSPWRGAYPGSLGFLAYLLVANIALFVAYATICATWKYRTTPTAR